MPGTENDHEIGRWRLTGLIINSVIGAGIFGLPGTIAKQVGDYAPWAYVLGALMTVVIVAVVVELSSQFNEDGGAYRYVRAAFGPALGLQTGWFSWLARVTTAAAIANLLASYAAGFWPVLSGPVGRNLYVLIVVGGLAAINIRGVKQGVRVSDFFTVMKLLPLLLLVILGAWHWRSGAVGGGDLTAPFPSLTAWMEALIAMVFAFSGFESAMIAGSRIKDPLHNTGPAAFTALLVVFMLYVCLHVTVMHALPDLAGSERPLSDAAAVYAGEGGRIAIAVAAIVSTFGWLSAAAFTAPRLTSGMAEKGDFPAICGQLHPHWKTPWASIALWAGLVIALAAYGTFFWNVVLSVTARLVVYSTMCAAVIQLRRKGLPHPAGITVPVLGIGICLLLATRLNWDHLLVMLVVGVAGVLTWWAGARRRAAHEQGTKPDEPG